MCCVMFISTQSFPSDFSRTKLPFYTRDGEDNSDSRSAPGKRGGPARLGFGEESFPQRRFKGNSFPLRDQKHPLCPDGVRPSPSLAVL